MRCLGRTESDRKITNEPWSSMKRSKRTNKTTHRSEWRSLLKKDLTGPTLLEMSGSPTYRDLRAFWAVSHAGTISTPVESTPQPSARINQRRGKLSGELWRVPSFPSRRIARQKAGRRNPIPMQRCGSCPFWCPRP